MKRLMGVVLKVVKIVDRRQCCRGDHGREAQFTERGDPVKFPHLSLSLCFDNAQVENVQSTQSHNRDWQTRTWWRYLLIERSLHKQFQMNQQRFYLQ